MTNLYCPNGHEIAAENLGIRTYCEEWPKLPEKTQIGFVSFCPGCNKSGRYYFSQDLLPHGSSINTKSGQDGEFRETAQSLNALESKKQKSYLDNININMFKQKLKEINP